MVQRGRVRRVGRRSVRQVERRPARDVHEMGEQSLRRRHRRERLLRQPEGPGEEAAWSGGIDHIPSPGAERLALPRPEQLRLASRFPPHTLQRHSIHVLDAQRPRFLDQEVVEVGPQPVGVGHFIARAGGDQQLVRAGFAGDEGPARRVGIEAEPPLQATADVRIGPLPLSILSQRHQPRQIISPGELFQHEVGQRRGGLADGKTWVSPALEEEDGEPEPPGDHRRQRAAEAGADDGEVKTGTHSDDSGQRCSPLDRTITGDYRRRSQCARTI